jgi:hypothetical protein
MTGVPHPPSSQHLGTPVWSETSEDTEIWPQAEHIEIHVAKEDETVELKYSFCKEWAWKSSHAEQHWKDKPQCHQTGQTQKKQTLQVETLLLTNCFGRLNHSRSPLHKFTNKQWAVIRHSGRTKKSILLIPAHHSISGGCVYYWANHCRQ